MAFVALLMTTPLVGVALPVSAQAQVQPGRTSATRAFDIAAQPLNDALTDFGQQSGLQVSVDSAQVRGIASPGVKGSLPPLQALSRMLSGTGFVFRINGTIVTLEPAPRSQGAIQLGPVQVEGDSGPGASDRSGSVVAETARGPVAGYVAKRSASGTKADTALLETPQTISVVTRDQMDAQNVQSVPQALRYTSGVFAEQRGVNTDALEYINARGFRIDEYWNGLRLPNVFFNITSFDAYMFERIELVHGPASVLYGQTAPGGLLNLTSKHPTDTPYRELMIQTGSFGRVQGAVDLSGPANAQGTVLYRLTADAYDVGSRIDHVDQRRIMVAPALTWKPDADTSLTLLGNYLHDPRAGVFNYVPAAGTVLPGKVSIPRSLFTSDTNADRWDKETWSIGYEFEHRFSDAVSIEQNARYLHNSVHIKQLDSSYGLNAAGTGIVRESYTHDATFGAFTVDTRGRADFATGPVRHTLTAGLDHQRTTNRHIFVGQGDGLAGDLDIADPQYGIVVPVPDFIYGSSSRDRSRQTGLYLQDQLYLGKLVVSLGGRQDWANDRITALKTGAVTRRSTDKFTWKAGAIYPTDIGIAPYFNYSTSFQPIVGLNSDGSEQKPTVGEQYEGGIKFQPNGVNAFVTVSAFHLTQSNVVTTDSQRVVTQTGEVRSQGVEVEAHATLPQGIQIAASYSYDELANTRTTRPGLLGKAPAAQPRNQAALWTAYDIPAGLAPGLNLGAGVRYVGPSWGDATNSFRVPAATLFDAAVHYDLGRAYARLAGWNAAVSASNLFDKRYISSCSSLDTCTFGSGRVMLANLKYRW